MMIRLYKSSEEENIFDLVKYDNTNSYFTGRYKYDNDIKYHCPYHFEINRKYRFNKKDFYCYLFHKIDYSANDVIQIFDYELSKKGQSIGRIGYMIPIQALMDNQIDDADNEHFWPYAYHATRILMLSITEKDVKSLNSNIINLEDIYGENSHILILYRGYINQIRKYLSRSFDIHQYLPYLWKFGYVLKDNNTKKELDNIEIDSKITKYNETIPSNKKIKIKAASYSISNNSYVEYYFRSTLKYEFNSIFLFHILYQFIEIMIEHVFDKEFGLIVEKLKNKNISNYDAKKLLNEELSEVNRIKKLYNGGYVKGCHDEVEDIRESCNKIIQIIEDKEMENGPLALHRLRSLLFHRFKEFPKQYEEMMSEVKNDIERLVIESLVKFND